MADHSINVGNVELVSLSDGEPIRSPFMPFPDTTIEQWRSFLICWTATSKFAAGTGLLRYAQVAS